MNIQEFKNKVSLYQSKNQCKRSVALHAVAKELGFKNYNAYLASQKKVVKKEKESSLEEKVKNISFRLRPQYVFLGPIVDGKTGEIIENPHNEKKQEFLDIIMNSKRFDPNEPIYLGTGKQTVHDSMWNNIKKELSNPDSKLLKGYFPEDIKTIEYPIEYPELNKIETQMNYHNGNNKYSPLWIKNHKINIPDDVIDRKKYYYSEIGKLIETKPTENITLENMVQFILNYDSLMEHAQKEYSDIYMCGCLGPKNGNPLCPCQMKTVFKFENLWFFIYKDYRNKKIMIQPYSRDNHNKIHNHESYYVIKTDNGFALAK